MGTSLNGLTPAGTYPGLIKTGDNAPIDGTLKTLSDGNGNNLPMSVSTTTINLTGTAQVGGVAIANTTQVAAKQDTLVSGTNIKTINGTSLLGSGNIPVVTSPSGVAGAIQFTNGSAFASDAANLFWDDTNNRLGVGTNSPTATAHIVGANNLSSGYAVKVLNSSGGGILSVTNDGYTQIGDFTGQGFGTLLTFLRPAGGTRLTTFNQGNSNLVITNGIGNVTFQNTPVQVVGSGSTSATTSLLVQNSGATNVLSINDGGGFFTTTSNFSSVITNDSNSFQVSGGTASIRVGGTITIQASAIIQADSTTQGFLPPRMTTTQKNAIASPAAGLVVYDTTTNKLCCYNGSTWNDLF